MAILDIFKRKPNQNAQESNTLFGQTALGNNILRNVSGQKQQANNQLLYVTTSSVNTAGRVLDMSTLSRNSTVMACVNAKARTLAQLPIKIMAYSDDGKMVDAITDSNVSARDKAKAKAVYNLLNNPNHYQSAYEFWYQWSMWYDLSGETFTALWRKEQTNPSLTPMEMYLLDSTLIHRLDIRPIAYLLRHTDLIKMNH